MTQPPPKAAVIDPTGAMAPVRSASLAVRIARVGEEEVLFDPTGAGAVVGLVDSGVDASHPWLADADIRHLRVQPASRGFEVVAGPGGDESGHGTACAGIIHRMVPGATIVSVRALGPDGRCSRDALLAALAHCVKARFQVANLSLGIDIPRNTPLRPTDHRPILALYEIADAAHAAGVMLVASGPNVASFRTYPGRCKALIGVGRAPFDDWNQLATARCADHEIVAPGTDILAPALGGGERRWTGTSFACPFVASHLARIMAAQPGLSVEAIRVALHLLAARSEAGARERSEPTQ